MYRSAGIARTDYAAVPGGPFTRTLNAAVFSAAPLLARGPKSKPVTPFPLGGSNLNRSPRMAGRLSPRPARPILLTD